MSQAQPINEYGDAYNEALRDATNWPNLTIRAQVDRLMEVRRNLEYKERHTDEDRRWIKRTAGSLDAYQKVLKDREASDLELSGQIDLQGLCQSWKKCTELGGYEPLYWMLHGIMMGANPHRLCYAVSDLLFLKVLCLTRKEMEQQKVAGCSVRTDWPHGVVFEVAIGLDRLVALQMANASACLPAQLHQPKPDNL